MQRNWQTIGTWVYTGITGLILIFSIRQTYLLQANNVVSQRAYVSVQFDSLKHGNVGEPAVPALGIFLRLENTGGTPTKDLTSKIVCEPQLKPPIEPWDLIQQHKIETTPFFIGAKCPSGILLNRVNRM